jgi:hypothetical protein
MNPNADSRKRILDIMEDLESQVRALKALSSLLCGCSNKDGVEPSELTYLLDPIIEREKSLVDEAFTLLYGKAEPARVVGVRAGQSAVSAAKTGRS